MNETLMIISNRFAGFWLLADDDDSNSDDGGDDDDDVIQLKCQLRNSFFFF